MATRIVCLIFLASSVLLAGLMVDARSERELVRAGIQSLEKALIMKLIEKKIAHIQPATTPPTDAPCVDDASKRRTTYYVRENQLSGLTNLDPDRKKRKTYLYVPAQYAGGKALLVKSSGLVSGENHAEDNMETALDTLPLEFWETNSPCPYCAKHLIDKYNAGPLKTKTKTIKFMHFYIAPLSKIDDEKVSRKLSIQCMAAMLANNFKLEVWDWDTAKNNMNLNARCMGILEDELNKPAKKAFLDEDKKAAKEAIAEAKKFLEDTPADAVCNPTYPNRN